MKRRWDLAELSDHWTLLPDELSLVGNKSGATRLGFALLLKAFQLEGRFPKDKSDIPQAVIGYVAKQVNVPDDAFAAYDWTGRSARYHRAQIREFFGFREATVEDTELLVEWLAHQELVLDTNLEALLATAYERCRELQLEPPTPERMHRLTRSAIRLAEKRFTETILGRLPEAVRDRLDALLEMESQDDTDSVEGEANEERITWYRLKADPGAVGLQSLLRETAKLEYLRQMGLPDDLFADIPAKVIKRYWERAAAETIPHLRRHPKALRLTLLVVMCWQRRFEITDGIVDLMLRLIHRIETKAEKRIQKQILADIVRVSGKSTILVRMAEAALEKPDEAVAVVIYPAAGGKKILEALVKEHRAGQSYRQQVLAAMRRSYQNHVRRMVPPIQEALEFESNNTVHRPVLEALEVIKTYIQRRSPYYPADVDIPLAGVVPPHLRDWVVKSNDEGEVKINRINYEICVLQSLRTQVRCKEIWVPGADKHRNPDEDLPQDFETQRERYYQILNQPLEADSFIAKVKTEMREALAEFNQGLPSNADVTLRESKRKRIKLTPLKAQPEPSHLVQLKQEISRRWGMMSLLDMVKETELRVGFTQPFKSVTAWQSLSPDQLQKRLLLCIYGWGTNIGLKRVCQAEPQISHHDLAYVHRRFLQRDALRQAIIAVANATFAVRQAHIWGESTTACASDAKKFAAWDQNLLTEWHARYGGRGIMIYWHVERKSVCIHSQLKSPSSSEVAAMIQGVLRHCTTMEIDRQYVDTHGQSVIAFAFSHVLGFELMPRLKGISRQRLYLPDQGTGSAYANLQPILTRPIRWELIRQQYDQIIKYATALKQGTAEAEAILRRFMRNTQHPTYRALVELGQARKSTFLGRYLHHLSVRHEVQEGLNVLEDWNSTNGFILYGKHGEIASNRLVHQEISMLCLHLLQACLVYINTLLIQGVLASPTWYQRMTKEDWRALTPLFYTSVTPYGDFRLDMTKRIPGLEDIS